MKPSRKMLLQALALSAAGDLDLLQRGFTFSRANKPIARQLAELPGHDDDLASVEFHAACAGRRDAFQHALARRMSGAETKEKNGVNSMKPFRTRTGGWSTNAAPDVAWRRAKNL